MSAAAPQGKISPAGLPVLLIVFAVSVFVLRRPLPCECVPQVVARGNNLVVECARANQRAARYLPRPPAQPVAGGRTAPPLLLGQACLPPICHQSGRRCLCREHPQRRARAGRASHRAAHPGADSRGAPRAACGAVAIGQSIPEALLSPSMTPSDAAAFSRLAAGSVKLLRASATLCPNAEKAFMPINA